MRLQLVVMELAGLDLNVVEITLPLDKHPGIILTDECKSLYNYNVLVKSVAAISFKTMT
jgi:hypothetical protein